MERSDLPDPPIAGRVLAALEVLGWPDDRERSAHVEEDGYEVVPAGHYWALVCDVLAAADLAAELVERSDLPEGQQSKRSFFSDDQLAARDARVRADTLREVVDLLRDHQGYMAWRRQQQSGLSYGTSDVVYAAEYVAAVMQDHAVAPAESVVGALPEDEGTTDDKLC